MTSTLPDADETAPDPDRARALERGVDVALRRLLPLLVAMYVIAYIDRINITFAEDQLSSDLALTGFTFGLAAGIFFVGFIVFEVPSNLILTRVGARIWLGRIMITWGAIAAATAIVWDATSLAVFRFLLGLAEAGFYPGVIYFLATWFPDHARGRAFGIFMSGLAIAAVVGGPLSGALLELDGVAGLDGWQWMFLGEGLPAVAIGIYALRALPERPSEAEWMPSDAAVALEQTVAEETAARPTQEGVNVRAALLDRGILRLSAVYLCIQAAAIGIIFFLSDIIERIAEMGDFTVGLIASIPFAFGAVGLYVVGKAADRAADRRRLITYVLLGSAASVVGIALLPPVAAIGALCVTVFLILGAIPAFWSIPTAMLAGRAAAGAIALIASIGSVGALIGPVIMGGTQDATGSLTTGLLIGAGLLTMAACLVATAGGRVREPEAASGESGAPAAGSHTSRPTRLETASRRSTPR